MCINVSVEIKLLKFRFIHLKLQVAIKIINIKGVKYIKTGYVAANY